MSKDKRACITLDLENDWYFDEPGYDHLTLEYIEEYISLINSLDIPVSIFAVGETIEQYPSVIDTLDKRLDSEFHLHAYHHKPSDLEDLETELELGIEAFESHFGTEPIGYRAPRGDLEMNDLETLDREGFAFDSSVFPSYRPGVYNNLREPQTPYRPENVQSLVEIPIATTPVTRIPICQSYLKLFGTPYLHFLRTNSLTNPLVFNTHLHDFFYTDSHEMLSQPRRFIFKRNLEQSITIFREFVGHLRKRGYSFVTMTDLHQSFEHNEKHQFPVAP